MYTLRFLNRFEAVQQVRRISNFPTLRDLKPTNSTPNVQETTNKSASSNPFIRSSRMIVPRNFDKKVLVWMKYYKSVEEIPEKVAFETMDKAQNWFRIRIANYLILFTLLCTFGAVLYGKDKAQKGQHLEHINVDWHSSFKRDAELQKPTGEKKE